MVRIRNSSKLHLLARCMGRILFCACIVIQAVVHAPCAREDNQSNSLIAFRYDDTRVIFVVRYFETHFSRSSKEWNVEDLSLLPEPAASLGGMTSLWEIDETRAAQSTDPVMKRWMLWAENGVQLKLKIQNFALVQLHCLAGIAAIADVSDEDRSTLRSLRRKYYVVSPLQNSETNSVVTVRTRPALLRWTNSQQIGEHYGLQRVRVEEVLKKQFDRELSEVRDYAEEKGIYARSIDRWQELDQRLKRGEGKLFYDLQVVRVTPNGEKRFYMRAQWTIDRKICFLMSLWVNPKTMQVEAIDSRPSKWLRLEGWKLSLDHLGMILNVVDHDGDGWGEILVAYQGYEGLSIELLEYSALGPEKTDVKHGYGC